MADPTLYTYPSPLEGYREACNTRTVLGARNAEVPVVLDIPITIAGMSFGALSATGKESLGRAATFMGTSTTTGDGGMTEEERKASKTLVYQCLPSRYGFRPEDLQRADAIEMVIGQGGDVSMVDDPSLLPKAPIVETVSASRAGYVSQVAAEEIAIASFDLGAGREKKGASIDFGVGLEIHVKVGDKLEAGAPLVTIHAHAQSQLAPCRQRLEQAILLSDTPVEPFPLFYGTIYGR